jgi:hypothetical protein
MRDCPGRSNSRISYKRSFLCVEWLETFIINLCFWYEISRFLCSTLFC